jgi:hypothetical protein
VIRAAGILNRFTKNQDRLPDKANGVAVRSRRSWGKIGTFSVSGIRTPETIAEIAE